MFMYVHHTKYIKGKTLSLPLMYSIMFSEGKKLVNTMLFLVRTHFLLKGNPYKSL
jgi:F0F1-type ATP synthase assembly protein I